MPSEIEKHIQNIPDFPQKGIIFRDITPLLENHFSLAIDALSKCITPSVLDEIDAFVGIDSRGFIFAAALAEKWNKNLILIRKKGKLPPPVISQSYQLEYGQDQLEMKANLNETGNVIVIDDVLATGGTLSAAAKLCEKAGYNIKEFITLINLKKLNNFEFNGLKVKSVIHY